MFCEHDPYDAVTKETISFHDKIIVWVDKLDENVKGEKSSNAGICVVLLVNMRFISASRKRQNTALD